MLAADGAFYGATQSGGTSSGYCPFTAYPPGCGTIFKITPDGEFTSVRSFCQLSGCADGIGASALIQAADGAFYGTSAGGGSHSNGTIFQLSPDGVLTVLYSFCPICPSAPNGPNGLVQAADGAFYGTTSYSGSVFKFTPNGGYTDLYNFTCPDGCPDGVFVNSGLFQATDGNFYGTTNGGGGEGTLAGTIFQITRAGSLNMLHVFCVSCGDSRPSAGLVQHPSGAFYGTADSGAGEIFRFTTGLGPFVNPQPALGQPGSKIYIVGEDLMGATTVTFNGTKAAFTVPNSTLIVATVPTGATSGLIQVVTPNGTLTSNPPFSVLH